MLDDCNNCLCPGGANLVNDELALEKALKDNELERKSLINDFENCGVSFPVTELEMYAHRKLLDEYTDPEEGYDGEGQDEDGDATLSADNLTNEDYATGIPEDLKDLLRKYYQLEAEREELLRMAGTSTAPNSVNGDEEHQPVSLRRVSTPRAPFWYFRRRSVAIVESEGDHVYETQERSGQSRHAWVPDKEGDDTSHTSHVTVVYPKERARKIRMGMFCCCLVMLGLAAVTVFYAMDFNETEKLEAPDIIEEVQGAFDSAFTTSPTASWEAEQEPCRDDIFITGNCFVRSETFGARFKNCNPCKLNDMLHASASQNYRQSP
jgi:hypothetical protein